MDRELFLSMTIANLIYVGVVLGVGFLVAAIVNFTLRRIKKGLRQKDKTNLAGQIVDDIEEPFTVWILLGAIYLASVGLPALSNFQPIFRMVFTVLSIVIVVYAGVRVQGDALSWYIRRLGRGTTQTKVIQSLVPMVRRIASIGLFAMGMLIILDQLGISIAPLVAGLGIGGLAVALALQGSLTNFFAGLNVLTDGAIRVGDFVELDTGMRGYVDQIGWRTTRIRLLANNMVIIPNSKLAESVATNYNYPDDQMAVYVQLGVAYDSDLDKVEHITTEIAKKIMKETPGSVTEYEPSVWYTEFADSNINFWVVMRAHAYMDTWLLQHNFIKTLHRRYKEEGIEISFPARNLFMRGGSSEIRPVKAVVEGTERTTQKHTLTQGGSVQTETSLEEVADGSSTDSEVGNS